MSTSKRWALVGACTVMGASVLGAGADLAAYRGRIHRGVVVGGIDIGGLPPDLARRRIEAFDRRLSVRPVEVKAVDREVTVWPSQVSFSVHATATVERAYRFGRRGFPDMFWDRLRTTFSRANVEPVIRYDSRRMELRVTAVARTFDRQPQDARVIDIDGRPVAVPAVEGLVTNQRAARDAILAALTSAGERTVDLPAEISTPRLGTEAARAAAAELDIAMSEPITLRYKDRRWVITGPQIRKMMLVSPRATSSDLDSPLTLVVEPSPERVQAHIARVTAPIVKPAVDARFIVSGETVRIAPSKTGLAVDTKAAFDLISRLITKPTGTRRVSLEMHAVDPKLTTAAARQMGIRERIARYTTTFSSGNPQRVNNIHLLSRSLNNTLIGPGDEFSFNRTIGPRTAAKGYQEAPIIVRGKLVPGLGGGICQVGTTIFNTVFFSGLPITERHNHSFYISHYPDGRDATVSWGGPDFRFRNDTPDWLLIKADWGGGYVSIALYGTNPGYTVAHKTSPWRSRVAYPVREIGDPELLKGTKIVEDVGVDGHDVTVVRTVTRNGKVVREDTFSSSYRPKEQVVRAGTKVPPKPKPEPAPKPKPEPKTPPATPTVEPTKSAR